MRISADQGKQVLMVQDYNLMLFTDIFIPFKLVGPLPKMATLIINLRCFSAAIALSLISLSSFAYFSLPGHFVTLVLLLLQNLVQ